MTKQLEKVSVHCCILQYLPNKKRREFLNVGIVSFVNDKVDVILTTQKERIVTSFPEVNFQDIESVMFEIKTLMQLSVNYKECYERLKKSDIPCFSVSPLAGFIIKNNIDEYKKITDGIMGMYVNSGVIEKYSNKVIDIYSPALRNLDSFIVGTKAGLISLRSAIDKALVSGSSTSNIDVESSDGDKYNCKVIMTEDEDMPVMEPMYKDDSEERVFGELTPEELYFRRVNKIKTKRSRNKLTPKFYKK